MTTPINDPASKKHCCQFAMDCCGPYSRIQSLLLIQVGGDPEDGASISAKHRVWWHLGRNSISLGCKMFPLFAGFHRTIEWLELVPKSAHTVSPSFLYPMLILFSVGREMVRVIALNWLSTCSAEDVRSAVTA